jgi:hypothetical protein
VYKKILRGAKLKTGKIGQKKIAERKQSMEEAKVRIGLYCHIRRRRRRSTSRPVINISIFIVIELQYTGRTQLASTSASR